jgi:hypothetical protein
MCQSQNLNYFENKFGLSRKPLAHKQLRDKKFLEFVRLGVDTALTPDYD